MSDKLKTQVDELAAKYRALVRQRDGLDRQIEAVKIRLEAFQDAYAMVNGQPIPAASQNSEIVTPKGRIRPVIRHLDPWEDALAAMQEKGGEFTTDAICVEARSRGGDIIRSRARTRLAHLVDRKVLKRIRDGVFEFPPVVRKPGEFDIPPGRA
jgi:hypothetical protein